MQEVNPNTKPTEKQISRIVPYIRGNGFERKKDKNICAHRTGNTIEIINDKTSYPFSQTILHHCQNP